jgi:hypothetical protein
VETLSIVAEFDVPGNVCAGVFAGGVDGPVDSFDFHSSVERFGKGVVETHSGSPDGSSDVEQVGRGCERLAGILCSAVGVKYCTQGEGIIPGGHGECVDHEFGAKMVGHGVIRCRL